MTHSTVISVSPGGKRHHRFNFTSKGSPLPLGPGGLSWMPVGRHLGEGEGGMEDGGNRVKGQTGANVKVPAPVWEQPANPFGLLGQ